MKNAMFNTVTPTYLRNSNILTNIVSAGNKLASTCHMRRIKALTVELRNLPSIVDASRAVVLLVEEADDRATKAWYKRSAEDIEKQSIR